MGEATTVDEASRAFRGTLDVIVSFVSELASHSEETLVLRFSDQSEGSSHSKPQHMYANMHDKVLQPLVELLKAVHQAMTHVDEIASQQSEDTPRAQGFKKQPGRKSKPAPPPTIMSITHLRALYTTIEILWCWGVESVLSAGSLVTPASNSSSQASYPKSLLLKAPLMQAIFNTVRKELASVHQPADLIQTQATTLWSLVLTVDQSVRHLSLRGMMLQRNLHRIVLAAIALQPHLHSPLSLPGPLLSAAGTLSSSVSPLPSPSSSLSALPLPAALLRSVQETDDVVLYIHSLQHVSRVGTRPVQQTAAGLLTAMLLSTDLPISDSTDPVDRLGLTVLLRMHLHKGVADSANPTDLLVRIAKLVTSVPAAYTRTSSSNTSTRVNNISTGPFASTVTPATIVQAAATATATALHTPAAPVVVPPAASTHIVQHSPTPIASSVSPSHMSKHMHDNKSSGKQKSGVFFDNIASQALLLMMDMVRRSGSAELEEGSSYIMRVCVLMTARIAHMAPQSAHTCIFLPLAGLLKPVADEKPADGSIKSNGSNSGSSRDSGLRTSCGDEGQGAMKEEGGGDVSTCVRVLHWVVTCFPLSSPILQALGSTDIVSSLLSLQVHLLLHVSSPVAVLASDMKVLVADICIKLLRNIPDPASIVYTLEDLIVHGLKYGYSYSSSRGSDGGVVVAVDRASVQEEGEGGRLGAGEGGEMDFLSCLLREAQTSFGGDTDVSPGDIHQTDLMSLAGQMNALVQRSEAVCRILSSTLAAASKEGGDGHQRPMTEPAETTTTAARSNRGNTKPKSSLIVDRDEGGLDSNKAARIASLLFLRALSGYLGLCVPQGEGSEPESNPPSSSGLPPPHICGATLLVLKDNMSLEILLHDAAEIIQLLGFFLENRANDIRRTANYGDRRQSLFTGGDSNGQYAEGDSAYVQQLLSSSHNSKGGERPLIEEITTSAENRKKEQPSAENKPYHDDSNAFKSLNNLSLFDTNQDEEDGEEEEEEEGEGEDIISTVMALLVSMLEMGSRSRRAAEETLLRDTLLPHLVTIAGGDNNVDVAQTASDLCLLIMTRNTTPKKRASADKEEPREGVGGDAVSPFHSVCDEVRSEYLFDESPAMRGLGVRTLIIALREPPEPLSAADLQEASCLLLHLLQDPESFVYLNAIHAIGRLIDHHRTQLFKTFLSYYAVGLVPHAPLVAAPSSAFASSSSSCAGPQAKGVRKGAGHYQLSLRHRAVLSEAIGCALRRADQLAHQHVPAVVAACLQICRRRTHLQSTLNSANADDSKGTSLIDVDLTAMRVAVVTVEEESGGYDGPNSTQTQDQAQARVSAANREATVQQVCESADEVLFRQSAFSLLAEAIGLAGLTVRHHLPDVVDVAIGALRHETSTVNNSYDNVKDVIPVRRSAIFLLRYIVSGLEKHLFAVDAVGSHLKEIYRTLKVTARDKDDVVKFHAECGLAAVDAVMRAQLTLSEAQLTGEDLPKIRVIR